MGKIGFQLWLAFLLGIGGLPTVAQARRLADSCAQIASHFGTQSDPRFNPGYLGICGQTCVINAAMAVAVAQGIRPPPAADLLAYLVEKGHVGFDRKNATGAFALKQAFADLARYMSLAPVAAETFIGAATFDGLRRLSSTDSLAIIGLQTTERIPEGHALLVTDVNSALNTLWHREPGSPETLRWLQFEPTFDLVDRGQGYVRVPTGQSSVRKDLAPGLEWFFKKRNRAYMSDELLLISLETPPATIARRVAFSDEMMRRLETDVSGDSACEYLFSFRPLPDQPGYYVSNITREKVTAFSLGGALARFKTHVKGLSKTQLDAIEARFQDTQRRQ